MMLGAFWVMDNAVVFADLCVASMLIAVLAENDTTATVAGGAALVSCSVLDWAATALKTVILLSDGGENCGGKTDDVEAAYRGTGIDIVVHVIGFDVRSPAEQRRLKNLAEQAGGKYFSAKTAKELAEVLAEVTRVGFEVTDKEGREVAARGTINGPEVQLRPGDYQVRLLGSRGKPVPIHLADNQEAKLTLDEHDRLLVPK
jgi:hypothetical protein